MIIVPQHSVDNLTTEASLGTADIIVEAITEVLPLKQRLFKQWDQMCPDKTIFATNTSFLKVKDDMCAMQNISHSQILDGARWQYFCYLKGA